MTTSVEPFEASGENTAALEAAPTVAAVWVAPEAELVDSGLSTRRWRWFSPGLPRIQTEPEARRHFGLVGFVVAFVVGAVAALFLLSAVAFAFSRSYSNRVLPGVHVGSVDLSGLTRDEAITRLQTSFAYLSQGEVTVTTPVGDATVTYQQAGRGPDVEAMADAAMAVGHSGNDIADTISLVHFAGYSQDIPVAIQIDPTALATRIRELAAGSTVAPRNAQATVSGGVFGITPAADGKGLDETAIQAEILDQLTQPGAAADLRVDGAFVAAAPQVSDEDAQNAIFEAEKMIEDVNVTWSTPPPSAPATWTPQTWTIDASQIRDWIVFGTRQDGTYGPAVDPAKVQAYLSNVTASDRVAPVEPGVVWDASGKPVDLTAGKDGLGVDAAGTTSEVSAYLDALASGGSIGPSVEVVTAPVHPQITSIDDVAGMVDVGQWTTTFYPDISNGMGKNIRQPATNLNGQVINPGQEFSFLGGVGPIDPAHGFAMGGVIKGGKSDHTGAMGGGICSASTTMFNAAANAGLQIDERHAHFYYINRYPVGRDATVYSDGATTWDVKWTNDTPYPIVIRAWATKGSKSTITIQLWSWPTNRTVTWSGGGMADIVKAVENPPEYTSSLPAGTTARAEFLTNGFKTSVTRIVTDASGKVIHDDTWGSSYAAVNGQLLIGGAPPKPQTPAPAPVPPTPAPAVIAAPDATSAGRPRRVG